MHGEVPSIEAIAHNLAISIRHLQRELQAEGTSYQQLLDATRKELALRYLKKPNRPLQKLPKPIAVQLSRIFADLKVKRLSTEKSASRLVAINNNARKYCSN